MSEDVLRKLEATVIPSAEVDVPDLVKSEKKHQKQQRQAQKGLDYELIKLLEVINANPCRKQYERREALGWSNDKISNKEKQAEAQGLIEAQTVKTGGRGRSPKYYVVTEEGQKALRDHDIKPEPIHGSLEHFCLIKDLEQDYQRNGYKTDTDMRFGEFRPDIFCQKKGEKGLVEVVVSAHIDRDLKKLRKLAHRVDWIHLYFRDDNTRLHYERMVQDEMPDIYGHKDMAFLRH